MNTRDTQTIPINGILDTNGEWEIFPEGTYLPGVNYNHLFYQMIMTQYGFETGLVLKYPCDCLKKATDLFKEILQLEPVIMDKREGQMDLRSAAQRSNWPYLLVKSSLENVFKAASNPVVPFNDFYYFLLEELEVILDCSSVMAVFEGFVGKNPGNSHFDNAAIHIMATKAIFEANLEIRKNSPTIQH